MAELFKFLVISGFVYLFFLILRDKYFKHMVLMVVGIVIFGSGYLWCVNVSRNLKAKVDTVNERVYSVQESIDKFNSGVQKVGEVKGKADNVVNKVNQFDKRITNTIDRWLGRGEKDKNNKDSKKD